jgi:hypothetical protein
VSTPRRDAGHAWHVAINQHSSAQLKEGKDWPRFMYEAKHMAAEVPRMALLFKQERERALPDTHQQCSYQEPVPVKDNHLSCCLGVKCRECPHLLALDKIERADTAEIDEAKAWTCAAHIVSSGGDIANEGYLLRVDDRMFWDNVYASLAAPTKEGA